MCGAISQVLNKRMKKSRANLSNLERAGITIMIDSLSHLRHEDVKSEDSSE
jgi:hypothetical protein